MNIKCPCCSEQIPLKLLTTQIQADPQLIIEICAAYFKVTLEQVFSKNRAKPVVAARHTAIYFLRQYTKTGVVQIGKMFNRDHTTVLNAITAINNYKFTKAYLYNDIMALEEIMNAENKINIAA